MDLNCPQRAGFRDMTDVILFVARKQIIECPQRWLTACWILVNLKGIYSRLSVWSTRWHHREDREMRSDDLNQWNVRWSRGPSLGSTLLLKTEAFIVELLKHPENICEDYRVFASPPLIAFTVRVARWGEVQLEAWIRSFCCVGACRYCRQRVIVNVCGEGSWMHILYASSHFSAVF